MTFDFFFFINFSIVDRIHNYIYRSSAASDHETHC